MSSGEVKTVDFFVEWFQRGLHSLIENLILNLDMRSISACQSASEKWCNVINFYLESKCTKFQKLKNIRISEEWQKKSPVVSKISLQEFNISNVNCFHIIGDVNEVAIAAKINRTNRAKIIILNSKTASVKLVLDIINSVGVEQGITEIKMAMDENFLVAYIHEENSSNSFYQGWHRNNNYSFKYPPKCCQPEQQQVPVVCFQRSDQSNDEVSERHTHIQEPHY